MFVLASTAYTLTLTTGSAVSTDYVVNYLDSQPLGTGTYGCSSGAITTATTTTILAAPGTDMSRRATSVILRNRHASSSQTLTLIVNDGTARHVSPSAFTLLAGESVMFANGTMQLYGTDGLLKVSTLYSGNLTASGDLAAAGGFRQQVGPFYVTTAADQTAVGTKLGDTVGQSWIAPYAGSVMAHTGMVDAAVTGAGKSIKARVYKALAADTTTFSLLNAALDLDFTQATGERADSATAAKDTYTFAAGDALKIVYTTDTITNTPKLVAFLTVEC